MDSESLSSILECPICYEVRRKIPIFNCVNGHHICSICYDQLLDGKKCPHGGCDFNTPPSRNRQLEALIAESNLGVESGNQSEISPSAPAWSEVNEVKALRH